MTQMRTEPVTRVIIYTDGGASPNPGLGGWGAVLILPSIDGSDNPIKTREIYGAERDTTNNRMELTAAIMALKALRYPCLVELYTDSMYLRNAFEKRWLANWQKNGWQTSSKQPVLNKDLWLELLELAKTHRISWHWTKGHSDNVYNNTCDALVQRAKKEFSES